MKRTVLAFTFVLGLAGCRTPIHLGGEYRSKSHDLIHKSEPTTLIEDDRFTFFWGLLDSGDVDVHEELEKKLRPNECFVDLDVRENTTTAGVIIGWLTGGIVSHHEIVVRGRRGTRAPAPGDTTVPAGAPRPAEDENGGPWFLPPTQPTQPTKPGEKSPPD